MHPIQQDKEDQPTTIPTVPKTDDVLHIRCTGELPAYAGESRHCNRWLATLDKTGMLSIACPKCKTLHPVRLADLVTWLSEREEAVSRVLEGTGAKIGRHKEARHE